MFLRSSACLLLLYLLNLFMYLLMHYQSILHIIYIFIEVLFCFLYKDAMLFITYASFAHNLWTVKFLVNFKLVYMMNVFCKGKCEQVKMECFDRIMDCKLLMYCFKNNYIYTRTVGKKRNVKQNIECIS